MKCSEVRYGKDLGDKIACTLKGFYYEGTCLYCDYFICVCLVLWLFELVMYCVGVLVMCVLVFTVFCTVCTAFLCCLFYVYLFLFG
jgi:hypothetical protein